MEEFQSSFELTGYITISHSSSDEKNVLVSKLFRAYGLYNMKNFIIINDSIIGFKALSSLRVI